MMEFYLQMDYLITDFTDVVIFSLSPLSESELLHFCPLTVTVFHLSTACHGDWNFSIDQLSLRSRSMIYIQSYPHLFSVGGIPARSASGDRLLLFIGIIDILQNYRLVKKMEHVFKAVVHDGVNNGEC